MKNKLAQKTGMLIVISGASASGKDAVIEEVLKNPLINKIGLRLLVSCADRPPRPWEIHGKNHFFVTPEELDEMYLKGELVEKPQLTGSSRKATPRKEFANLFKGSNILWRIDTSLASKVALGTFFDKEFDHEEAEMLKRVTKVFCISSPKEQMVGRRKMRDGKKYNAKEYELRDAQDEPNLKILRQNAIFIDNLDGQLEKTVEEVVRHTLKHLTEIDKVL